MAKKKTKRKTKRKVQEDKYDVTLSKGNSTSRDVERTVSAKNPEEAMVKAKENDPEDYDSANIKRSTTGSRVRTEPQTASRVRSQVEPENTALESITYPYNIGLPKSFDLLIEALTKKTREPLEVTERFSRLHITVPDAKAMKSLVEELSKKSRGRAKVKGMAETVYNGITESI